MTTPYFDSQASSKPSDLKYVLDLARKHYEEIGFLPAPRLAEYEKRSQLWVQRENGDPCGFLVFGNGWPLLRVYQTCIQYDAQRRRHGEALVERLKAFAERQHCAAIRLYCADDLPANQFWAEMGFRLLGQRSGGMRRGRKHNLWSWRTSQGGLFDDHAIL